MAGKPWKVHHFFISRKQFHPHHPSRELWPNWVIKIPASCHFVVTAFEKEPATDKTLADLRGFIDSLETVYLLKRRELDEKDALLDKWIEISKNENKGTDK